MRGEDKQGYRVFSAVKKHDQQQTQTDITTGTFERKSNNIKIVKYLMKRLLKSSMFFRLQLPSDFDIFNYDTGKYSAVKNTTVSTACGYNSKASLSKDDIAPAHMMASFSVRELRYLWTWAWFTPYRANIRKMPPTARVQKVWRSRGSGFRLHRQRVNTT